jgi:flagellar biosynthesis protein FlhB
LQKRLVAERATLSPEYQIDTWSFLIYQLYFLIVTYCFIMYQFDTYFVHKEFEKNIKLIY